LTMCLCTCPDLERVQGTQNETLTLARLTTGPETQTQSRCAAAGFGCNDDDERVMGWSCFSTACSIFWY
jgi:hypothetical protein